MESAVGGDGGGLLQAATVPFEQPHFMQTRQRFWLCLVQVAARQRCLLVVAAWTQWQSPHKKLIGQSLLYVTRLPSLALWRSTPHRCACGMRASEGLSSPQRRLRFSFPAAYIHHMTHPLPLWEALLIVLMNRRTTLVFCASTWSSQRLTRCVQVLRRRHVQRASRHQVL